MFAEWRQECIVIKQAQVKLNPPDLPWKCITITFSSFLLSLLFLPPALLKALALIR
jgi:hypothetical protein